MGKNKRIIGVLYLILYIVVTTVGCGGDKDNISNEGYHVSKEKRKEQNATNTQDEVNSEESVDNETLQDVSEDNLLTTESTINLKPNQQKAVSRALFGKPIHPLPIPTAV